MATGTKTQVLIVAAESSSGLFAQRLLEQWKKEKRDLHAFGVGTPEMEAVGFERLGKSEDMAVVGVVEIMDSWDLLKSVFNNLQKVAEERKPAVAVLMDYPEFNLMLAKKLSALGIPVVYYISPQVWAWRKGRVNTIKKFCKKVLVIFPFEVEFYKSKNVPVEFVGHPVLDELKPELFEKNFWKLERRRRGIADEEFVLGLMPGSRRSEIKQHLAVQLEVASRLSQEFKNLKVILLVAPTLDLEEVRTAMGDVSFPIQLIKDEPMKMIGLADFMLAASGTATLMVALLGVPMVIMYRFKWFTGIVAKILVRGVKFFGLPNLISGREIVPERWQEGADPDKLASLIAGIIKDPARLDQMRKDLSDIHNKLGQKGATERVVKSLDEYV